MKALAIFSAALFGILPGFHTPAIALEKITSAQGLERMRGAPLNEVLEVFTGKDYLVQVPGNPRGVVQTKSVSVIDVASSALAARIEETREPLLKLLESESHRVRARVLGVLARDDLARLAALKPKVVPMLKDHLREVRRNAVELLAKVKDEPVEIALVEMLGRRDPVIGSGDEFSEISRAIEILCNKPVSEDRVVLALIPWLDESKANSWVVNNTIRATAPFSRSGPHAARLMECFWQILRTTGDDVLQMSVTRSWERDHPLSLAYLRRVGEITDGSARSKAAGALMHHAGFDPHKEMAVIESLLADPDAKVRAAAVSGLCHQPKLAIGFRVAKALPFMASDPSAEVRNAAAQAILVKLTDLPAAEADALLVDPSLALAERMLAGLKDEALQGTIAFQTGWLSRKKGIDFSALPVDRRKEEAVAWWEVIRKEPTGQGRKPGGEG